MKGFWTKKLPAALLTLVMLVGMVPSAAAYSWADIEAEVDMDSEVSFARSKFKSLYDGDGTFSYLEFDDYDDFDDYGYFETADGDEFEYSDLDNAYFYYYSADAYDNDEYELDGLTFVTYDDVDDEVLSFDFTLYGVDEDDDVVDYEEYTLEITVNGGYASDVELEWEVEAGDELDFDAEDFWDLYDDETNGDLNYIKFTDAEDLDTYGTLKLNSSKITESTLSSKKFYYDNDTFNLIEDLTYYVDDDADDEEVILEFTMYGTKGSVDGTLTIYIGEGTGSGKGDGDIDYETSSGKKVTFDEDDFKAYYNANKRSGASAFSYVTFEDAENLDDCGKLYAYDYYEDKYQIKESKLDGYYFYYDEDKIEDDDTDYCLMGMYYQVNSSADDETVTLNFTVHGTKSTDKWSGTLTITIGDGGTGTSSKKGDITYKAPANKETAIDPDDFNDYFQKKYNYDIRYVEFTDATGLTSANGALYVNYDYKGEKKFSSFSSLEDVRFYYEDEDYGDYDLADLSFVAAKNFKSAVTLKFRAYYSSSKYVDGTLVFDANSDGSSNTGSFYMGNIRYSATTGNKVQINANDIARFYSQNRPGCTLSYVKLNGVPATGALWYNYYGTSKYGGAKAQITSGSASSYTFYNSPSAATQFALTELTYVPTGTNYCTAVPFTAYGTGSSVSGAILISVTGKAVSEVYSVTTKNTPINLSANSIYNVVLNATGYAPSSIQFLGLPTYAEGSLYLASSYTSADITTRYTYGSGNASISQLQFMPTSGFTGSVELPYVALNANGTAIASGVYSIGVVSSVKRFSDVTSSTWCYKYVTELSDANVISGYTDGSFKPNNTVTYGAALKLIMLAAGYPEQKPINSNVFSGYLAKAKADGLVSGNINLTKPITRGAVAQIAAKAMKLSTSNLSAVKPFTDTSDPYIQALNAAGIVEGYFANGTSTFKPNNTLTRGQVSAIVWRMRNFNK